MGTTLENGTYLPSEGERNCYSGLANNWQAVDTNIGYVTALRQAIAGALTRQIVTQLPTEDIDPNCIYMILKATAQTSNIYDEYMYINSAWELIGDSQLDLSNYYTKQEVNQLPAVASGVTSTKVGNYDTHIADGDIHVTASDKAKWNTVALIKHLRLVNTQVGSATTIAFADIDDTNGIKVGDKCMDLDAKMFEITAVDATNEIVTVGSALIDIALDADVVHKSGNETATGFKQFDNIRINNSIKAIDLADTTTDLNNCYSDFASSDGSKGGNIQYYYCNTDAGTANISNLPEAKAFFLTSITTRLISNSLYVKQILINLNNKTFTRYCNNTTWGSWVNETDSVYVHKRDDETITGTKTFGNGTLIVDNSTGSNVHGEIKFNGSRSGYIVADNASDGVFDSTGCGVSILLQDLNKPLHVGGYKIDSNGRVFADNTNKNTVLSITSNLVRTSVLVPENDTVTNNVFRILSQIDYANGDTSKFLDVRFIQYDNANATSSIYSNADNKTTLGVSSRKWSDVLTYKVNGVEPSVLSMPTGNSAEQVDISGYFTNVGTGETNSYTAPANGWIYLRLGDISGCQATVYDTNNNRMWGQSSTGSVEQLTIPILKGQTLSTQWNTGTSVNVANARFIPCQGNI